MESFIKDLETECDRLEKGIKVLKSVWSVNKQDENKTDFSQPYKRKRGVQPNDKRMSYRIK